MSELLTAYICLKTLPNVFVLDPTTERYLFCFCLRDSASEFVNVACWGNVDYINIISEKADVGHVGKFLNMQYFVF